jgi:hypothetical protein
MFAIDIGDGALAASRGGKPGVVCEHALFRIDPADIEPTRTLACLDYGQGGFTTRTFQDELVCQGISLLPCLNE